jgi:antitoxin component HigA of HigAB toxin-antitoxin module
MAKHMRPYRTVQEWMAATGTNQSQLARLVGCKQAHLSNVLSKSRRCSLALALKLMRVTNVPIEVIAEWPHEYEEVGK